MKKKMPRHDEQFDAMMQVIYLMDAAYAIYRATYDEDPVTPEEVSIASDGIRGNRNGLATSQMSRRPAKTLSSCWTTGGQTESHLCKPRSKTS